MKKLFAQLAALVASTLIAGSVVASGGSSYPLDRFPTEKLTDQAALQNGAKILRAHDVKEAMQTVQLFNQYNHAAV